VGHKNWKNGFFVRELLTHKTIFCREVMLLSYYGWSICLPPLIFHSTSLSKLIWPDKTALTSPLSRKQIQALICDFDVVSKFLFGELYLILHSFHKQLMLYYLIRISFRKLRKICFDNYNINTSCDHYVIVLVMIMLIHPMTAADSWIEYLEITIHRYKFVSISVRCSLKITIEIFILIDLCFCNQK
jgi:hypothetical protein